MPYFIETWDNEEQKHLRAEHRNAHLAYLDANKHRIIACGGKLLDDGSRATGAVLLVDVETREEAEAFIAEDPFTKAGLVGKVSMSRWRRAFVNGERYTE